MNQIEGSLGKKINLLYNPLLLYKWRNMQDTRSLCRIFSRFFPKKSVAQAAQASSIPESWDHLSLDQKKDLACQFVARGELALLNDDLSALGYFETAEKLAPGDPLLLYRQGLAFFDYGLKDGQEKSLLLAGRSFKLASFAAPERFEIWAAWGHALLELGAIHQEHHFYLEAKEKFQKAISHGRSIPRPILAQLYWNYGLIWTQIAQQSGEAVDVQSAIQAFCTSMQHHATPPPEFLNDCGSAYLQMGSLINDTRLYLQAADLLRKATAGNPLYIDGWNSLANVYSQLYLNTMDERYATEASDCFAKIAELAPGDPENWLAWAQLLNESGRLNRDSKKLLQAIEKCTRGCEIDPFHPELICQWVESLSRLSIQTNRLEPAVEAEGKILRAIHSYPENSDLWHAYGICLFAFGHYYNDPEHYQYAIEKLQHGLSLDRTHAEIWHALALAHLQIAHLTDDLDMVERATRFFTRALDLKPACPSLMFDAANAWLLSSDFQDSLKDLEQALALYEPLLQNHKETVLNHPEWLFQYATALEWLGDYTNEEPHYIRAMDLYLHVLLIDPETPKIHLRIAICLIRLAESSSEAEYYRRALHYFRFAARQDPEEDAVWIEWGLALVHLAQHSIEPESMHECHLDAEQKLIRAGQLGNLSAPYNLACLYSILGRYEEAMIFIQKARDTNALPSIEDMLEDEWLDNLRHTEAFVQFLSELETK